jgi:molybdopterin molybdotransferase
MSSPVPARSLEPGRGPVGGHLLTLEEAHERIARALWRSPPCRSLPLAEAVGRYAAEPVVARLDRPEIPRAAMDGYAVRASDGPPSWVRASVDKPGSLRPGEAVPVSTGGSLPPGSDAVVRREATRATHEGGLEVLESLWPGKDVHPVGEDVRAGDVLLARGERVRSAHLGVLIEQGLREVPVLSARVGLLAVGTELVPSGAPSAGRTTDSISPMLLPLVPSPEVAYLGPVGDDPSHFRRALEAALAEHDLVITVGGASVGDGDPVKPVVSALGELLFEGLRANVLKRAAVGQVGDRPIVILPGQPVAAVTAFHEIGLAVLERMWGVPLRRTERWPLAEPVAVHHRMDATLLFRLEDGVARPLEWGVARYGTIARADGYAVVPRGTQLPAGAPIAIQRLGT